MAESSNRDWEKFYTEDLTATEERLLSETTHGCPVQGLKDQISQNMEGVYEPIFTYQTLLNEKIPDFVIRLLIRFEVARFSRYVKKTLGGKLNDKKGVLSQRNGSVGFIRWHQKLMRLLDKNNLLDFSQSLPSLEGSTDISGEFSEAQHYQYLTELSRHIHAHHLWNVYSAMKAQGVIDLDLEKDELVALIFSENFLKTQEHSHLERLRSNVIQLQAVLEDVIGMAAAVAKNFPGDPKKQKAILRRSLWWTKRLALEQPNHWRPHSMLSAGVISDIDLRENVGHGARRMPFLNPNALLAMPEKGFVTPKPEFLCPGDRHRQESPGLPFHKGCAGLHIELKNGKSLFQHFIDEVIEVVYSQYFIPASQASIKTNSE